MNRIKINRKLKWKFALIIIAVVVVAMMLPAGGNLIAKVTALTEADVLLIDPGHGGIDGGASSASGVSEKDINLAIALYVRELAEIDGWKVVMTRDTDKGLYKDEDRTIRSLKTQDLIARKEMIQQVKPIAAVSIHLNSFKQDSSVRGAQTFFPVGPGEQAIIDDSKILAEAIQEQLIAGIQDGTERVALAKRDSLIFKHPAAPMALVECGFLSNPKEADLLQDEEYQRKLAKCIYDGIMIFSGKEQKQPPETIDSRG